jgi:hypothetical protein
MPFTDRFSGENMQALPMKSKMTWDHIRDDLTVNLVEMSESHKAYGRNS